MELFIMLMGRKIPMNNTNELDMLKETYVRGTSIFEGRILNLREDFVSLPNQSIASRELIRHIGAVCIIPVTEDKKVVIERQFRYPVDQVITEIPAGKLDRKDEDRLEAAKRELREETGYTADHWEDLGIYYPAAAYCDEKITMYLATGLHEGKRDLDEDEFLNYSLVPLEDLVQMVLNGEIPDGKTQVAILKVNEILKNRS